MGPGGRGLHPTPRLHADPPPVPGNARPAPHHRPAPRPGPRHAARRLAPPDTTATHPRRHSRGDLGLTLHAGVLTPSGNTRPLCIRGARGADPRSRAVPPCGLLPAMFSGTAARAERVFASSASHTPGTASRSWPPPAKGAFSVVVGRFRPRSWNATHSDNRALSDDALTT